MGISDVMNTGRSGLMASKAAISTAGHNISNANTEGYSRQRVETEVIEPQEGFGAKGRIGRGVQISRVSRINDDYLDKQLRQSQKNLATFQEKETLLTQLEGVFNEMDDQGLNRMVTRFFNEFRSLANEPEREALREAVRESSTAVIKDLQRLRGSVDDISRFVDSRIEGAVKDLNSLSVQLRDINEKIRHQEAGGGVANDLNDQRDQIVRRIGEYLDISTFRDEFGAVTVNIKGLGPLVAGPQAEQFSLERSPADDQGKPENAYDLKTTAYAGNIVTHMVKGGKLGGLLEVRDQMVSKLQDKLDDLAFTVSNSVNQLHRQGFTVDGYTGVNFFKELSSKKNAAQLIDLSDAVKYDLKNIAVAATPNAPADNRVALGIAALQGQALMSEGRSTMDDFYNAMVSDIGVLNARNRESLSQQTNINRQLGRMRDQVSGVSIDEETSNLLQFQHIYDASAKVVKVADEMLKTILEIGA